MAIMTLANPADVANRLRTYFNPKLLKTIENELVLNQFANQDGEIQPNTGSKTIRFFKRRPADASQVVALTDGTPINTFTEVAIGYVDCTLTQTGQAAKVSDLLRTIDLLPIMSATVETMGEDAALKFDSTIRDVIIAGFLNSNNKAERFAGVLNTNNSANDFATLAGKAAADSKMTRARGLAALTQMKRTLVPKMKGGYVCAIPPVLLHDLRQDPDWVAAATRSDVKAIYKDEVINLDGVRYVEHTNPEIENAVYGTYDAAGSIYTAMYFGRDAYGCPKITKLGNGMKPQIVICDKADKSDMINQFTSVAWKAFWNAVLLKTNQAADVFYGCLFRCKTTADATT